MYWYHTRTRLADKPVNLIHIDKSKPSWLDDLKPLNGLGLKHVQIGDGKTFQYLYGFAIDDPTCSVWLLHFFAGAAEQIIVAHTGERLGAEQGDMDQRVG